MRPLDRWNPLTPVAMSVFLVVAAYAGPALGAGGWSGATSPVLALALALALAWTSGVGARVTALSLGVAAPTFALLFVMNAWAPHAGPAAIGPLRYDPAAARDALLVAVRLGAAMAAIGWVVVGIAPRRLTRALAERGLPAWAAYVLVASLDAVPEAKRRAGEVLDAQRCRGLATHGRLWRRVRSLAPLAGPLAVSLVTESEERALALDARGFSPRRRRTALTPIADPHGERFARVVLWAAAAGLLLWHARVVIRGPG